MVIAYRFALLFSLNKTISLIEITSTQVQKSKSNFKIQCATPGGQFVIQTKISHMNEKYSGSNSCCNKALFMKQMRHIQMCVGQYKNAATPLRTRGINTTHQYFQMRYITLIYLKGLKSYQPSNFKCVVSVVKQTLHFYFNQ